MNVYVLFAHPSRASFTGQALAAFAQGLEEAGHQVQIGDLYQMGFDPVMDPSQYERESGKDLSSPLPQEVAQEQAKLEWADGLAFVFPLWWSDCPAILKGWFEKVYSYGFAHRHEVNLSLGLKKAQVIATAGHPLSHLESTGVLGALKTVLVQSRLAGLGVQDVRLEVLDGMIAPQSNGPKHLIRAHQLGLEY
ncbi:MAG: hypothetical protein A2600_09250 [Candidatus Lambdaproteobacteria bacterium RIFOXYD1_FULL_56_27]|uniref:Flavodoxin-like fold domain-containing protein n=1 Tax=Candidatus Lambdaproteobacteria bacterium RIFOXYD2_FULL_56_26 TaxID=1817773 RepID=A0A1F6GPM0_9PROT|nr:MAG: hypothetical protein A2557_01355 [Candidatus Lambdaproteobacteria bacterium RIFOXYD2_FULL_56_26]OGH05199.1 MAG: hypothetical protein A2426_00125 [Candidatus Lambdaproteobacteria bacterium RIFOXYC1_FULL_56_13]OGH09826.1 MAG: hypothetical protein A2600_09250 [Candidatus Lambdaproteobacteria bacterium RIFOXYD1_FULL_56_27]